VAATMAGLHMRTWSNSLPWSAHPATASDRLPVHGKKRVPAPVWTGLPYALAEGRAAADAKWASVGRARLSGGASEEQERPPV